ncbi:hypothetical protein FAEPRAA2165_02210 [Faecalibacterium duncaniae]|uniref:Uncharacterized protein n=1 Tax=Faecalibacterium duncaniae (strain DSM 17677 / JCM 31915 / A2-165) TaxID=411483 RepID=C7H7C6_FAED2|nr:hypothetical protein FAEPRAA2165_02210 [Faecalibacterium duncaniae]
MHSRTITLFYYTLLSPGCKRKGMLKNCVFQKREFRYGRTSEQNSLWGL